MSTPEEPEEATTWESIPGWLADFAQEQYGVDIHHDLGQGVEVPQPAPTTEDDPDQGDPETRSWWKTYWSDTLIVLMAIMVVGLVVFATLYMRLL